MPGTFIFSMQFVWLSTFKLIVFPFTNLPFQHLNKQPLNTLLTREPEFVKEELYFSLAFTDTFDLLK